MQNSDSRTALTGVGMKTRVGETDISAVAGCRAEGLIDYRRGYAAFT
jgi:hypothetical protein